VKPFQNEPAEAKRFRTIRELENVDRDVPDGSNEEITDADLRDLFDYQAYVANKATALIREVKPLAEKLSIPVDIDAVRVRDAVRRQMGGGDKSDGSTISFDIYKQMYDEQVRRSRKLKFEIVGEFTGDASTDAFKIKKHMRGGGGGLSKWDEFLLSMEPWLLWLLLNQLIGQHQGIEHQEACAAKQPAGSEVGPIQLRIAISMAAMMLILGMQEDVVLFAVNQPSFNFPLPGSEILAQARRLVESDGMHRQLKEIQGATDPMVITAYADNYITRQPDGYEAWVAYRDLRDTREQIVTSYYHSHQYSEGHRTILEYETSVYHETPGVPNLFPNPFGTGRRVRIEYPDSSTISTAYYRSLVQGTSIADRNINAIAGVMTSGFALDVLCCFARFMVKTNDVQRIQKIRDIIAVSIGVMQNGLTLTVMSPRGVLNWAIRSIQNEIIAHIHRAFDNIIDDVAQWTISFDPDVMEDLTYCPFIWDLLQMIQQAIQFFREQLFSLVRKFMVGLEEEGGEMFLRWGTMYDLRRARVILTILDRILATVEYCADDGSGTGDGVDPLPDPGEDDNFFDNMPRPLKLPPEVVEKFFPGEMAIERGHGQRSIPAPGTEISSQEQQVTVENYRKFCLGIVPDAVLNAIIREDA